MKTNSRLICSLLAFVITASMMAGCGGSKKNNSSTSTGSTTVGGEASESNSGTSGSESGESTDASGTGDTTSATPGQNTTGRGDAGNDGVKTERNLEGNIYTSGFPIAKKTVTLKIMAEKTSLHSDFNTMAFTKYYEQLTNVKIQWDIYSTAERVNKKTLALSSGNIPDVMCMLDAFTSADIIDNAEKGLILQIDDKLQKWAPNIKKALDTNTTARKSVTAPDGHIYSVPFVNSVPGHDDFPNKILINKTWLDNLGLSMPKTYSEMIDVLEKFKNGDPNGNGIKDEIPMAVPAFDPMFSGAPQGIAWSWTRDRMYVNSAGKVGYFMASDAFRDSIKFFKTLYSQNLLDKNVFEGVHTVNSKVSTGRVGVFTGLAGVTSLPEKELKNYEIMPVLKATASSKPTVQDFQTQKIMPFAYVITASAAKDQKIEAALRWVDYFFTTEGYVIEQYGPTTGGYYKKLSSGKIEKIGKKTDADRYKVAPGYILPSWYTLACRDIWVKKSDSQLTAPEKFFKDIDEAQSEKYYRPLVQTYYIPHLFFDKVAAAKLNSKSNGVHSAAYNDAMSFVRGDSNIDTGWNDYLSNLKRLGVDDMVSVYQNAYNKQK